MESLIKTTSKKILEGFYNEGLLNTGTYINIMECKNKKQLLKTLQTPELVRPEYEDAIFRLIRNNRDKSNPEDTLLTPREMNLLIEIIQNSGVMLRKNVQKLFKTEYMLREAAGDLVQMGFIVKLELYNFQILFLLHPRLLKEIRKEVVANDLQKEN